MANPTGKGGQKSGEPGRNPNGRPPGRQSFIDRAKYWLEDHTAEEIIDLIQDEKKAKKLGAYDYMILHRIVEAFTLGGRQSMDGLLDRLLGKPAQYIETKNETTVEHKPISATASWLEESLGAGQAEPPKKPV